MIFPGNFYKAPYKMKRTLLGIISLSVFLLSIASVVCAGDPVEKDKEHYVISPNDILNIQVYQEADLSGEFEVKESGSITYPLLGPVKVAGLTKTDVEKKFTELLGKDYLVEPFIHVVVKTYHDRNIMVLGCVQKPGAYPFPQNQSIMLLEAISMAGGFTGYASINGTKIVRSASGGKKATLDPKVNDIINGKRQDTELKPGDLVFVPERIF